MLHPCTNVKKCLEGGYVLIHYSFPGAIFILSSFYNRRELGVRIAIMYSGNSLSSGFGGLLSAAVISGMNGVRDLAGWRWLCKSPPNRPHASSKTRQCEC